jgi:hypothetical protein
MKNNIKRYPEVLEIVENFKKSELGIKYLSNIKKEPIQEYRLGLNEIKNDDKRIEVIENYKKSEKEKEKK